MGKTELQRKNMKSLKHFLNEHVSVQDLVKANAVTTS